MKCMYTTRQTFLLLGIYIHDLADFVITHFYYHLYEFSISLTHGQRILRFFFILKLNE